MKTTINCSPVMSHALIFSHVTDPSSTVKSTYIKVVSFLGLSFRWDPDLRLILEATMLASCVRWNVNRFSKKALG